MKIMPFTHPHTVLNL